MLIAREIVAVQFGCLGLWLWQRQRLRISNDRNPWRDQHPVLHHPRQIRHLHSASPTASFPANENPAHREMGPAHFHFREHTIITPAVTPPLITTLIGGLSNCFQYSVNLMASVIKFAMTARLCCGHTSRERDRSGEKVLSDSKHRNASRCAFQMIGDIR